MSALDKALKVAALGIPVFPVREVAEQNGSRLFEAKTPYTAQGFKNATTDPMAIRKFWAQHPNALVGYFPKGAGLVVLDIDKKGTKNGFDSLKARNLDPDAVKTFHYYTKSGGAHYIFKDNGRTELLGRAPGYDNLEGIDRCSGEGYAIWWAEVVPDSVESFAAAPQWLLLEVKSAREGYIGYSGTTTEWLESLNQGDPSERVIEAIQSIPDGDFDHNEMVRLQFRMVRLASEGQPGVDVALELLEDAWLRDNYRTLEYAMDYQASLAGAIAKGGDLSDLEKQAEFWESREVLKVIKNNAEIMMANPWALFGSTIQRALASVPGTVTYKSFMGPAALNTIIVLSGPSGTGKSVSQGQLNQFLEFNNYQKFESIEVGSGEAIAEQYVTDKGDADDDGIIWSNGEHSIMFGFDEIGRLVAMNSRQGSTVIEYLKTAFSGGRLGRKTVMKHSVELHEYTYRFQAQVAAQPKLSEIFFDDRQAAGGLTGRVLWFETVDTSVTGDRIDEELMTYSVPRIFWEERQVIKATPEMNAAHRDFKKSAMQGKVSEMDSHFMMIKAKVAIALAVLDGRAEVNSEDWALADVVMNYSVGVRNRVEVEVRKISHDNNIQSGKALGTKNAIAAETEHAIKVAKLAEKVKAKIEKNNALPENERVPLDKGRTSIKQSLASSDRTYWDEVMALL